MMSWLLVGGRFRIYAINGIGRRKGRVIEVEAIATGERFHGSARRMERLLRALQGSDDDRRHESGPDTWQDVVAVDLALRKRT